MGIREDMPLLARHEGVWDGVYTYYNATGDKVDEHNIYRLGARKFDVHWKQISYATPEARKRPF